MDRNYVDEGELVGSRNAEEEGDLVVGNTEVLVTEMEVVQVTGNNCVILPQSLNERQMPNRERITEHRQAPDSNQRLQKRVPNEADEYPLHPTVRSFSQEGFQELTRKLAA